MVAQTIDPRIPLSVAEMHMQERAPRPLRWRPRNEQSPPGDDGWHVWLFLAGRGAGKTRAAAEWVRQQMTGDGPYSRVALVGATAADVRDVMVEGESGLLAVCERFGVRLQYQPSRRRVLFPDERVAYLYSAEEPDRLRGPQHDGAWCDEIAAWARPETWDMLQLGLRLGARPRVVATTTPKPVTLVRQLVAGAADGTVAITRGRTADNAANLAPGFLAAIEGRYAGTRLGRQELEGELLEDIEGALWSWPLIEAGRVTEAPPLERVVVAIDPAATSAGGSNETGIIVAGVTGAGAAAHGYVLADHSGRYTPQQWASEAVALFDRYLADAIVIETNQGGEMATGTLTAVRAGLPIRAVHAAKGKVARAEPVSALYEQGRVHHVGSLPALEDQLTTYVPGATSPDRLDALVWAMTDLIVAQPAPAPIVAPPTLGHRSMWGRNAE